MHCLTPTGGRCLASPGKSQEEVKNNLRIAGRVRPYFFVFYTSYCSIYCRFPSLSVLPPNQCFLCHAVPVCVMPRERRASHPRNGQAWPAAAPALLTPGFATGRQLRAFCLKSSNSLPSTGKQAIFVCVREHVGKNFSDSSSHLIIGDELYSGGVGLSPQASESCQGRHFHTTTVLQCARNRAECY
jgi:hypothetical protein